jgi:hypothetical protein
MQHGAGVGNYSHNDGKIGVADQHDVVHHWRNGWCRFVFWEVAGGQLEDG